MRYDSGEVLNFWFKELSESEWFVKNEKLDRVISQRFGAFLSAAEQGELSSWRTGAKGRLAEIILLDQFSRNIYRDTPHAFKNDPMALTLSQELVHLGLDSDLSKTEKVFAYMPYMHSESSTIHAKGLALFSSVGIEENIKYELMHKEIIDKFGRFPHRNKILGRHSTQDEIEFLKHHPGF